MTEDLKQGTEEWRLARLGSVGASRIADLTATTKAGYSASRTNLMTELMVERLTGVPTDGYVNDAMRHGTETEPEARSAYSFFRDLDVVEVGLIRHPSISGSHASPDGLVGDAGLLEIKCPQTSAHVDLLLRGAIPEKYTKQCQWQLACTGRAWVDFVSYDNRLPPSMQLFVRRLHRDDVLIASLEKEVIAFLADLEAKITKLKALYEEPVNILAAG